MEETFRSQAIVLNRQPFHEDDSRVTLYTVEHGKLILVARGAKKFKSKLAGHLEPLCLSRLMVVRGRQYDYIGAADSRNCFPGIKNDLDKLLNLGWAFNIFNKLVKENQPEPKLFNLLRQFLALFEENQADNNTYRQLACFFVFKLIVISGYGPELYHCLDCRVKIKPASYAFDLNRGGLLCLDCLSKQSRSDTRLSVSDDCVKVLRLVVSRDLTAIWKLKINRQAADQSVRLIKVYLGYLI